MFRQEYSTTISENLSDATPLPGLDILVTDADVVGSGPFFASSVLSSDFIVLLPRFRSKIIQMPVNLLLR